MFKAKSDTIRRLLSEAGNLSSMDIDGSGRTLVERRLEERERHRAEATRVWSVDRATPVSEVAATVERICQAEGRECIASTIRQHIGDLKPKI